LEGILARRKQLVGMLTAEKNPLGSATKPVAKRIAGHVGWFEKELERTDRDLDRAKGQSRLGRHRSPKP